MTTQELSNLFHTISYLIRLEDLNSPRNLASEAEHELTLIVNKLHDENIHHLDTKFHSSSVIYPFTHSPKEC